MIERIKWRIRTNDDDKKPTYDVYDGTVIGCVYNMRKEQSCLICKGTDGHIHEVEISRFEPF